MQVSIQELKYNGRSHQFIINNFIFALKECNVLHILMQSGNEFHTMGSYV